MWIDDQPVQKHQPAAHLQTEETEHKEEPEEPEDELYDEEQEDIEEERAISTELPPLQRESVDEFQSNMVWQLVGNVSGHAVSFRGKPIASLFHNL